MIDGPHFRWLTNSYVKAIGKEPFIHERSKPVVVGYVSENGVKPVTYRAFDWCVVYNHMLYAQTEDGKAWERIE